MGIVALVIIGAGLLWVFKPAHHDDAALNKAEQQTLQTSLGLALDSSDDQTIVNTTTQLIDGAKSGRFSFSNGMLAQYYLDEATSLLNLKQYAQAIPAFEEAPKLDSSNQQAALEGEVMARYDMGQRQQLIPLLEQLKQLAKNSGDPLSNTPEQYQADITAIQHNQEVNLE